MADVKKLQVQQRVQKPFCQNFVYSRMLWSKYDVDTIDPMSYSTLVLSRLIFTRQKNSVDTSPSVVDVQT